MSLGGSFKEIFHKLMGGNSTGSTDGKNPNGFFMNLFVILIIGIIVVIAASTFMDDGGGSDVIPSAKIEKEEPSEGQNNRLIDNYAESIETKLEDILGLIKGIGEVKVMVTLDDTAERIPAINTTESKETTNEKDAQGGTRVVNRDDLTTEVVTSDGGGQDSLVLIKEVKPNVKGVVVVAEGTGNPQLKEKVYRAVKTALGIPGNRVEVFSSN